MKNEGNMKLKFIIPFLSAMLISIANAEDLNSLWSGEWGKWERYGNGRNDYAGQSLSINNCDKNGFCDLRLSAINRSPYNRCDVKIKLKISSSQLAEGSNSLCTARLTRIIADNTATVHLKLQNDNCRSYCIGDEGGFPINSAGYVFRSKAKYPDDEYSMANFKKACYAVSSLSMKTWCESQGLHGKDEKIRLLMKHIEKLTRYKITFDDDLWRNETIENCNNSQDIPKCLNAKYDEKITSLVVLEKNSLEEHVRKVSKAEEAGDPAESSKLISQIDGVYKHRFQNGNVAGDRYQSEDILEIVRVTDNVIYFKSSLDFFNGHTCHIYGIAKYTKDKSFTFNDNKDTSVDAGCILKIIPNANGIKFETQYSCNEYCGTRGILNGTTFKAKERRKIRYMKLLTNSEDYKNSVAKLDSSQK